MRKLTTAGAHFQVAIAGALQLLCGSALSTLMAICKKKTTTTATTKIMSRNSATAKTVICCRCCCCRCRCFCRCCCCWRRQRHFLPSLAKNKPSMPQLQIYIYIKKIFILLAFLATNPKMACRDMCDRLSQRDKVTRRRRQRQRQQQRRQHPQLCATKAKLQSQSESESGLGVAFGYGFIVSLGSQAWQMRGQINLKV